MVFLIKNLSSVLGTKDSESVTIRQPMLSTCTRLHQPQPDAWHFAGSLLRALCSLFLRTAHSELLLVFAAHSTTWASNKRVQTPALRR